MRVLCECWQEVPTLVRWKSELDGDGCKNAIVVSILKSFLNLQDDRWYYNITGRYKNYEKQIYEATVITKNLVKIVIYMDKCLKYQSDLSINVLYDDQKLSFANKGDLIHSRRIASQCEVKDLCLVEQILGWLQFMRSWICVHTWGNHWTSLTLDWFACAPQRVFCLWI